MTFHTIITQPIVKDSKVRTGYRFVIQTESQGSLTTLSLKTIAKGIREYLTKYGLLTEDPAASLDMVTEKGEDSLPFRKPDVTTTELKLWYAGQLGHAAVDCLSAV